MSPMRDELLAQIAEEEARLAALDHQRDEARVRLQMLRQQLLRWLLSPPSPPAFHSPSPDRVRPHRARRCDSSGHSFAGARTSSRSAS